MPSFSLTAVGSRLGRSLCLLLLASPSWAGSATLVADLDSTEVQGSSVNLAESAHLGDVFFFPAFEPRLGGELWKSDGTPGHTEPVRDLCPGECSSNPHYLVTLGDHLYFVADDGIFGEELWSTDGTDAGTRLVGDLCPGPCSAFSSNRSFAVVGPYLYFTASDGQRGFELWRTDGTDHGTEIVADLCPGECSSSPRTMAVAEDRFYFLSSVPGPASLWVSDGSPSGTQPLLEDCSGCGASVAQEEHLYFINRTSTHGRELWTSDGTPGGTGLVRDLCPGDCDGLGFVGPLALFRGDLYFAGRTTEATVYDLYRNADSGSPVRVLGFPSHSDVERLVADDSALYFVAGAPGVTRELFRSDGTSLGTEMVRAPEQVGFNDVTSAPALAGDRIFFTVDERELWTRGTHGAAEHLLTLPEAHFHTRTISGLVTVGGRVFFRGYTADARAEPWISDGTPAGTHLVEDIHLDPGSARPAPVAPLGNRVVFAASDDRDEEGLWVSDGSAEGTTPLGVGPATAAELFAFGSELVYTPAIWNAEAEPGLWTTDGTPAATRRIAPGVAGATELVEVAGRFFFSADGGEGQEPWVSDLTGPGTFQLGDLAPGVIGIQPPLEPASSSPKDFVALGSSVVFAASGEESGRELWITEGTVESTRVLADLCAGPCSSSPDDLVALSATVFFAADDAVSGRELWRTDGTSAGTALALDLVPGPGGSNPRHLQEMGGRLLFFASVGSDEEALWRWDPAGTPPELVAELSVAGAPSFVTASTQAGERLYFVVANQVTGPELWGSDGTAGGTAALELRPGPLGSYPGSFLTVGEQLLFAAEDGIHGRELWIADGAEVRLLADVVPGSRSSLPTELAATRETLFFSADDGVRGRELWSFPHESDGGGEELPPVPDTPPILSEAFPGFRFWVRITAGGAEQSVRREAACIPETLCVSGAVPGRSELFLRIVGPKPNGRLWPTLVRFSTSTIEVWIEQEATGSLRYYRLESATPGSSDLTGLFDREGFVPQGQPTAGSGLRWAGPAE